MARPRQCDQPNRRTRRRQTCTGRRIAVVGSGGAGKTTFARELGGRLGIPVIHLDEHYWRPGWVETPREEWRLVQERLVAGDAWIVDGNYGGTLDIRFRAADTVVLLDYSRVVSFGRALRRSLVNRGRAIHAEGARSGSTHRS